MRQCRVLAHVIDVAKAHHSLAFRGDRERSDGHVNLSQLQSAEQAVEGKVHKLDLQTQLLADGAHQCYVKAIYLLLSTAIVGKGRVVGKGRIVRRCADDDLVGGLDACPDVVSAGLSRGRGGLSRGRGSRVLLCRFCWRFGWLNSDTRRGLIAAATAGGDTD